MSERVKQVELLHHSSSITLISLHACCAMTVLSKNRMSNCLALVV